MAKAIKYIDGFLSETDEMTKVIALGDSGFYETDIEGSSSEWSPHPDWIDISDVANNEIHLLVADLVPLIGFTVSVIGGYTVDWGDGSSSENFASGATATHTYTTTGTSCSRGYTTFKIRIYAQTPANAITSFNVENPSTSSGSIQYTTNAILAANFGTTGLTNLSNAFYDGSTPYFYSRYLESVVFPSALNSCTSAYNIFQYCSNLQHVQWATSMTSCTSFYATHQNCYSLKYVTMPTTYSSSNINFSNCFSSCYALETVDFNASSLNISDMSRCFQNSYSLKNITLPDTVNNCSNWNSCFTSCYGLPEITLPAINTDTNAGSMFSYCQSIRKIVFPSSWNGRATNVTSLFQNCLNLSELTLFSSVSSSVTDFSSMFNSCNALPSVTIPSGHGTITNVTNMFYNCNTLRTVTGFPSLNSVSNVSYFMINTYALSSISNLDQLGDTTTNFDLAYTFYNAYSLESLSVRMKITGRFSLAGTSTSFKAKLNSLRLTNSTSTFAGSSPQIDIQYDSFDATALNTLFGDLPTLSGKTIRVTGNPGAATCDTSIATAKGWTVTT